ncbi:MAG: hypothetical protein ACKO3T_00505 [Planctomycetaceae bacterium]
MSLLRQDELLIQRCVDDELSSEQTRVLLERLDTMTGGWKTLACGFLEDRYLRSAVSGGCVVAATAEAKPAQAARVTSGVVCDGSGGPRSGSIQGRIWRHPLTSLALCAAIAFVGGLLIPDGVFSGTGAAVAGRMSGTSVSDGLDGGRMELQMRGKPSVRVPIYSDPAEWAKISGREVWVPNADTQYVIIPTSNGQAAVVPVSKVSRSGLQ